LQLVDVNILNISQSDGTKITQITSVTVVCYINIKELEKTLIITVLFK